MANGHLLQMAPALLVLPAGPSSLHPIPADGVWKARGAAIRPVRRPPRTSRCGSRCPCGCVRRALSCCRGSAPCLVRPSPPRWGRGGRSVAVHGLSRSACARVQLLLTSFGAPGAFQALTRKVPASGSAVAFPVPVRAFRAPPRCVSHFPCRCVSVPCGRSPEKRGVEERMGGKQRFCDVPCLERRESGERPPRALVVAFACRCRPAR